MNPEECDDIRKTTPWEPPYSKTTVSKWAGFQCNRTVVTNGYWCLKSELFPKRVLKDIKDGFKQLPNGSLSLMLENLDNYHVLESPYIVDEYSYRWRIGKYECSIFRPYVEWIIGYLHLDIMVTTDGTVQVGQITQNNVSVGAISLTDARQWETLTLEEVIATFNKQFMPEVKFTEIRDKSINEPLRKAFWQGLLTKLLRDGKITQSAMFKYDSCYVNLPYKGSKSYDDINVCV